MLVGLISVNESGPRRSMAFSVLFFKMRYRPTSLISGVHGTHIYEKKCVGIFVMCSLFPMDRILFSIHVQNSCNILWKYLKLRRSRRLIHMKFPTVISFEISYEIPQEFIVKWYFIWNFIPNFIWKFIWNFARVYREVIFHMKLHTKFHLKFQMKFINPKFHEKLHMKLHMKFYS